MTIPQGNIVGAAKASGGGGGSGTVTSVGVSGGTTGLTTSGGPVTTTGTITLAGTLAVANGGTGNTTGTATVNANLTGPITSVGNATSIASQTGTGTTFVTSVSPTITTSLAVTGTETITSTSATSLTVGANGATNPTLQVDASTASSATGVSIKSAAAGGGISIAAISSGTNEALTLAAKGAATTTIGSSTGSVSSLGTLTVVSGGTIADISPFQIKFQNTQRAGNLSGLLYNAVAGSGLTASTETPVVFLNTTSSNNYNAGAKTLQRDVRIGVATNISPSATTITTAANLAIDGAPIAGTNVTQTSSSTIYSAGSNVGSGTTNSYGLNITANTGATNNYAALFAGAVVNGGSAPSIAGGTGAGTSPTVGIIGCNSGGIITITTGATPGTSAIVATVTYIAPFPNGSSVVLYPANAATAILSGTSMVLTAGGTTTFTITSGAVALTTLTAYSWNYQVIGY